MGTSILNFITSISRLQKFHAMKMKYETWYKNNSCTVSISYLELLNHYDLCIFLLLYLYTVARKSVSTYRYFPMTFYSHCI